MNTLEIWMDGVLMAEGPVFEDEDIFAMMRQHPPKAARGGVVSLRGRTKKINVAISCHSTHGPRWGML